MTTSTKKQVVNYLLHSAASKLLAGSPTKSAIQKGAQSAYNQLRAKYSKEDVAGVDFIASILDSLIKQLVNCQSTEQLQMVMTFIESIEKGEVLIAEEDKLFTQKGDHYLG